MLFWPSSFAYPSSSLDNRSSAVGKDVARTSPPGLTSMPVSQRVVEMRRKCWGRCSMDSEGTGTGPLFSVLMAARVASEAAGPVTCKTLPCGHSHPETCGYLPAAQELRWQTDTIRLGSEPLIQSGRMQCFLCISWIWYRFIFRHKPEIFKHRVPGDGKLKCNVVLNKSTLNNKIIFRVLTSVTLL